MDRGSRIKNEIAGLLAILAGIAITLSLVTRNPWDRSFTTQSSELNNLLGSFGANLSDLLFQAVGHASYILPLILFYYGARKVAGKTAERRRIVIAAAVIVLILASASFIALSFGGDTGGTVGIAALHFTLPAISNTGSFLLFMSFVLVSLMYLFQFSVVSLAAGLRTKAALAAKAFAVLKAKRRERRQARRDEEEVEDEYEDDEITVEVEYKEPRQEPLPLLPPEIKTRPKAKKAVRPRPKSADGYELPSIDFLTDPPESMTMPSKDELLQRSELLEKKLLDYSIEGKVTHVSPGPIVTMFEFELAPGIKISKVVSLADDLAMALRAISIRISPIHGRSTLGIEVPNKDRDAVFLKDIIANEVFYRDGSKLTLALGKDIFGTPVVTDLSKMPHLLIAGATGSGKSVGLNSIVLSLLYKATPKEVKMLMIDPKMLELSVYEEIPHLLMPVITLPKEASHALKKMVFEMERRYRLLAKSGVRSIDAYNKKVRAAATKADTDSSAESAVEPLPYIVIFIDELADLMFASKRDVEDSIARLAGMARAAGIHLVIATQRPSVDVITGIIKANFPSRISFQVSSKMDSRIILDTYGADQLLGKGDMLFTSPGKKIRRIHGAYVSGEETVAIVDFIKSQGGPDYTLFEDLVAEPMMQEAASEDRDDLYMNARDMVLSAGQASISSIQRRMKIGYNRAARIMEMLEDEGIVGPPVEAGKPREVIRRR